jgi:prophage regulatory protein
MKASLSPGFAEALAVSAKDTGLMLGISERHVWALNSSGRLPRPGRFGRAVRWPVDELRAWLTAGSPERGQWEKIRN